MKKITAIPALTACLFAILESSCTAVKVAPGDVTPVVTADSLQWGKAAEDIRADVFLPVNGELVRVPGLIPKFSPVKAKPVRK